LAIEDVTERRAVEQELAQASRQKELLLEEMRHRIANSLQIIASILLLKAKSVQSDETRGHLQDAHKRVLSVAAVQQHLQASGRGEPIAVGPYLKSLCASLAGSMINENRTISLETEASAGTVVSSEAVSIGLIVTESVINALKYAFPQDKADARIFVSYVNDGSDWTLSIADNGIGKIEAVAAVKPGLGTSIVSALAIGLQAIVDVRSDASGTKVSVIHAAPLPALNAA
jgi:chemotaxis protein methyltransferase CheR